MRSSLKSTRPTILPKRDFVPIYYRIQQDLMNKIQANQLREGDLLESEAELARRYGVSRMTARQALTGLKSKGFAVSERGRGTFVSRPKFDKNIMHLQGFSGEMKERGLAPSSRLLEKVVIPATSLLISRLQLESGDKVLRLRRLRLANQIPMAIEVSHLPLRVFPGLDNFDFAKRSLYNVLHKEYGVSVSWADEIIEAVSPAPEEVDLLTLPRRSNILSITRLLMTKDDLPIELACSRYRGDRYRAFLRVPAINIEV
jgi:GntR family transcriptional regulator